jgi:tRNA pseudouridine55 synthase
VDGLFLFDKPQGITSHDAVARCRRWFGTRRVGHSGTLDPMATGLLVICINNATRMSEYLLGQDKSYVARVKLGERTNTDDADGEVVERCAVSEFTPAQLMAVAARFTGVIEQTPPQYSAIKKDGVRAYALARKGETVEIAARSVTVNALTLAPVMDASGEPMPDQLEMRVDCGSGTYVRALARDIGAQLGCGAHLTALRRTRIGEFHVDDAMTEDAANAVSRSDRGRLGMALRPMDRALAAAPSLTLDAQQSARLLMGQVLALSAALPHPSHVVRVYDAHGAFLAVAEYAAETLKPIKVFAQHHANSSND